MYVLSTCRLYLILVIPDPATCKHEHHAYTRASGTQRVPLSFRMVQRSLTSHHLDFKILQDASTDQRFLQLFDIFENSPWWILRLQSQNMAPHVFLGALSALCFLSPTFAHMQMLIPSPLRDPHSSRANEPKDWNILTPLHADGSDFACKGYQWNTPWTSVATYEAGGTYQMALKGSATHGGGSCQLSLSCDGGIQFKVIKSIIGSCPMAMKYSFTIPPEFARINKATCLFAWTWYVMNMQVME